MFKFHCYYSKGKITISKRRIFFNTHTHMYLPTHTIDAHILNHANIYIPQLYVKEVAL